MKIESYSMTLGQYAQHRKLSIAAIQRAIKENRLTENRSFLLTGNSKIKPRYKINPELADAEWAETTITNGNNIHSIAGGEVSQIGTADAIKVESDNKKELTAYEKLQNAKFKSKPKIEKPTPTEKPTQPTEPTEKKQSIPSIAESKAVTEYYNAQLKKVKLEKEMKVLVEYDLVEYIFKNMVITFKQRQLQIPSKLKLLIGKENALLVREEIQNALEELSELKMSDFDIEVDDIE